MKNLAIDYLSVHDSNWIDATSWLSTGKGEGILIVWTKIGPNAGPGYVYGLDPFRRVPSWLRGLVHAGAAAKLVEFRLSPGRMYSRLVRGHFGGGERVSADERPRAPEVVTLG